MKDVIIESYLLQGKLETALIEIVGSERWLGRELKVPDTRRRWDMAYEINGNITVVEYDGDKHYYDSLTIKGDHIKDKIAGELGYKVVRIPYWVQLTNETLQFYLGLSANIIQNFKHGFVETKMFPCSYSSFGVDRFENEINNLPISVKASVLETLKVKSDEYGIEYVLPKSLFYLLD
jgi:hypothetical protein